MIFSFFNIIVLKSTLATPMHEDTMLTDAYVRTYHGLEEQKIMKHN